MSQFINRNTLRLEVRETVKLPWTWEAKFRRLAKHIEDMPGEEVAPVAHANWVLFTDGKYYCTNCRVATHTKVTTYCPDCGARMDACTGKCEYAQMMERKRGKVLTPESCDLHRDKMCPELDGGE